MLFIIYPPYFVGAWEGNDKQVNFMEGSGAGAGAGVNVRLMRLICHHTWAPTIY